MVAGPLRWSWSLGLIDFFEVAGQPCVGRLVPKWYQKPQGQKMPCDEEDDNMGCTLPVEGNLSRGYRPGKQHDQGTIARVRWSLRPIDRSRTDMT